MHVNSLIYGMCQKVFHLLKVSLAALKQDKILWGPNLKQVKLTDLTLVNRRRTQMHTHIHTRTMH